MLLGEILSLPLTACELYPYHCLRVRARVRVQRRARDRVESGLRARVRVQLRARDRVESGLRARAKSIARARSKSIARVSYLHVWCGLESLLKGY